MDGNLGLEAYEIEGKKVLILFTCIITFSRLICGPMNVINMKGNVGFKNNCLRVIKMRV